MHCFNSTIAFIQLESDFRISSNKSASPRRPDYEDNMIKMGSPQAHQRQFFFSQVYENPTTHFVILNPSRDIDSSLTIFT